MPEGYYNGCVISHKNYPIPVTEEIVAHISTNGNCSNPIIAAGFSCACSSNAAVGEVTFERLLMEYHKSSKKLIKKRPKYVISGRSEIIAHLSLAKPLCFEKFSDNPRLGYFILYREGIVIGTGKILSVHKPVSVKEVRKFSASWPFSFNQLDITLTDRIQCFYLMYLSNECVVQTIPHELMHCIAQNIILLYYFVYYKK